MSEKKPAPSTAQLIVWSIPALAAMLFTLAAFVMHRGVEWGLGAMLFGILYFLIRYGSHTIDTPDQ